MISFLTHPVVLLTLGGALGTNARHWLSVWISVSFKRWIEENHWGFHFPLATFLINVTGSLLLGLFVLPFQNRLPHGWILLGVGFCGGYTTFSTFSLETVELMRTHRQPGIALAYVIASVVIGSVLTWAALAGMESIYPKPVVVMEVEDSEIQRER